jgi:hypothetical protein
MGEKFLGKVQWVLALIGKKLMVMTHLQVAH